MYKVKIIEEKNILNDNIVNNINNEYSYIVVDIKDDIKYIQYTLLNINADDYLNEKNKEYGGFYLFHLNGFFYYQCMDDINYILSFSDEYLLYNFKHDIINLVGSINNKINVLKEFNVLKEAF